MQPANILVALSALFLGTAQASPTPEKNLNLHPKGHIKIEFYNGHGKSYTEKVWPDGDEHWFNEGDDKWKKDFEVKFIKYYSEVEDCEIRCVPTHSYYPWNPIKVKKFFQLPDKYGKKVFGLYLEHPQPVEVIRCDLP
ncbi:hypothetical protein DHEL01_v210654 [Diaporthe helianthi]|uniref:Uncharacterized protein n=1 Tax=Diaporthe helianthi TaxID=158607 RepID=A0A2P5HL48_DIAHE|nr:hypothetical protein DHEL01_v210654 [Diaporthe helianthi]